MADKMTVNTNDVMDAIEGIDYPCLRDDLVDQAVANGAPDQVIELLQALPVNEFKNPADVAQAFGDVVVSPHRKGNE